MGCKFVEDRAAGILLTLTVTHFPVVNRRGFGYT
jgi:hypothetical protein